MNPELVIAGSPGPGATLVATAYGDAGQIIEARWMTADEIARLKAATARSGLTAADRHSSAAIEYLALQRAREEFPPPCAGDPRFTADVDAPTSAELADLCLQRCRIRQECWQYAYRAKPSAGVWGGYRFSSPDAPIERCASCGHETEMHRPLSGCFVDDCDCGKPET